MKTPDIFRCVNCATHSILIIKCIDINSYSRSNSSNKKVNSGCTVSVRGQVLCRSSFNCAGGPGDVLGVAMDEASCCLDNPNALAYIPLGSDECIACVGEL